jgi:hypothetical protein
LIKKQLFTKKKKGGQKIDQNFNFSIPAIWKKSHFFGFRFSCERYGQPTIKFSIDLEMLFIYRLIPSKFDFLGGLAIFDTTPISRYFGASRGIHGRIQHKNACFWI